MEVIIGISILIHEHEDEKRVLAAQRRHKGLRAKVSCWMSLIALFVSVD